MKKKYLLAIVGISSLSLFNLTRVEASELSTTQVHVPIQAHSESSADFSSLSDGIEVTQVESLAPESSSYTLPGVEGNSYTLPGVGISVSNEDTQSAVQSQAQIDTETITARQAEAARIADQEVPQPTSYEEPPQEYASEEVPQPIAYEEPSPATYELSAQEGAYESPLKSEPVSQSVPASSQPKKVELQEVTFLCGADGSTPATVAKAKGNNQVFVILWKSSAFATAGYDDQTRCKQVSARFEDYNKGKLLTYITTGKLNGQSVICLTSKADGSCGDDSISLHQGLLFTVKPGESSEQTLETLADVLQSESEVKQKPFEQ